MITPEQVYEQIDYEAAVQEELEGDMLTRSGFTEPEKLVNRLGVLYRDSFIELKDEAGLQALTQVVSAFVYGLIVGRRLGREEADKRGNSYEEE